MQQEAGRLAGTMGAVKQDECLLQISQAVAVADDGVKAESIHLLIQRFAVHDLGGGAVNLQAVHIDHDAEVIQLIVVGKHKCFPALALFDLAVTQQGVHVDVGVLHLGGQCHAGCGGNTLAQAAGAHINTGNRVHVGVALQVAAGAAQGRQVSHGEEPALCQHRVQARRCMALGKHKTVTVRVLRVLRIDLHFLKV